MYTDCGRLVGYVTSMDLLVHDKNAQLLSIVRNCEVVVKESDEYDDAIIAMRTKSLTYAPVVNDDNIVVSKRPLSPTPTHHYCYPFYHISHMCIVTTPCYRLESSPQRIC